MNYKELINKLSTYKRVIVGGIQRSGTTYGAYAIAKSLGYIHVDEDDYGVHNGVQAFVSKLEQENVVVQNTCHTHLYDALEGESTILVWMVRDDDDIVRSEDKINWHPGGFYIEKNKYRQRFGVEIEQWYRNAPMKKHYWELQKPEMKIPYIEVPYTTWEQTNDYVEKSVRSSFGAKQIK